MFQPGGNKTKHTLIQRLLISVLVCFVVFNYSFSVGSILSVHAEDTGGEVDTGSEVAQEVIEEIVPIDEPAPEPVLEPEPEDPPIELVTEPVQEVVEEEIIFEDMDQQMDQAFEDAYQETTQVSEEVVTQEPDTQELDDMSQRMEDGFGNFTDSMNDMVEDLENMFGVSEQVDEQQGNNTDTDVPDSVDSVGTGLDDLTGFVEDTAGSGEQGGSTTNNTQEETSDESTSEGASSSEENQSSDETSTTTDSDNNQTDTNTGGGGSWVGDESGQGQTGEEYAQQKFDQMGQSFEDVFGVKWEPPEEKNVSTHDVDGRLGGRDHEDDQLGERSGDGQEGDEQNSSEEGEAQSTDQSEEGEAQSNGSSDETQTSVEVEDGQGTQIEVDNSTNVDKDTDTVADTGNNLVEADGRMEGSLTTGNASLSGDQEIRANNTQADDAGSWSWTPWEGVNLGEGFEDGDDGTTYVNGEFTRDFSFVAYNEALIDNDFDALANTGYNTLRAGEKIKEFTAQTGDVWGKISLVNLVNINSIRSLFKPLILNVGKDWAGGSIDLMDILLNKFGRDGGISDVEAIAEVGGDDSQNTSQVSVKDNIRIAAHNTGLIFNDISFEGVSGRNDIIAGRKIKEMTLDTGDVEMSFNLFNLLNANFLYSDVSFVVVNVFDDFMGDIILPSPDDLFPERLTQAERRAVADLEGLVGSDSANQALAVVTNNEEVTVQNDAYMDNYIETMANTGANEMYFSDDAEDIKVNTGTGKTLAAISNMINQTLIGGSWFDGVFNIFGDWQGEVKNLPDNAMVQGNDESFVVSVDNLGNNSNDREDVGDVSAVIEGEGDDSINQAVAEFKRNLNVDYTNEGQIVNKIHVAGDSGSNEFASTDGKRIDLDTGNVKVSSNISNLMNTNVVGAGVMKFALNMFADKFDGNIVFGKASDLALSMWTVPDEDWLNPGDTIEYNIEVANIHDEQPSGGEVEFTFDDNKTQVVDAGGGQVDGNTISWPLEELQPGETQGYKVILGVGDLSLGEHRVDAHARVDTEQAERDKGNNAQSASNYVYSDGTSSAGDMFDNSDTGSDEPDQGAEDDNSGQGEYPVETAMTDDSSDSDNSSDSNDNNSDSDSDSDSGSDNNGTNDNNGDSDENSGSTSSSNSSGSQTSNASNSSSQPPADNGRVLSVTKSHKAGGPVSPGDHVIYQIVIQNNVAQSLYDVVAYDTLKDEEGNEIYTQSWPLDEVYPNEKIIIDYEIILLEDTITAGRYTNYAYVSGFDGNNEQVESFVANAVIDVVAGASSNGAQALGSGMGGGEFGDSQMSSGEQTASEDGSEGLGQSGAASSDDGQNRWEMISEEEFDSQQESNTGGSFFEEVDIDREGADDENEEGGESNVNIIGVGGDLAGGADLGGGVAEDKPVVMGAGEARIFRSVSLAPAAAHAAAGTFGAKLSPANELVAYSKNKEAAWARWWLWLVLMVLACLGGYYSWQEKRKKLGEKSRSSIKKEWRYILKK